MTEYCRENQIQLRPHAKTHKSAQVAKQLIQHGASGICCATLAEAEILGHQGVEDILITSPVVDPIEIQRLAKLNESIAGLSCVVDNLANLEDLQLAFTNRRSLDVLCDVDPGMHRTGSPLDTTSIPLIQALFEAKELNFLGIQFYAGNLMHVRSHEERQKQNTIRWQKLKQLLEELASRGIPCTKVSGGGTGTFDLEVLHGNLTELQAGSFPFMDRDYLDNEWKGNESPFLPALFVLTTVVSSNTPGSATTNAGLKAFATDSGLPQIYAGLPDPAEYFFMGDEHGGLRFQDKTTRIPIKTRLLVIPPHCDPTINLYQEMVVVDSTWQPIDTYSIDARSGNQYLGPNH